MFVSTLKRATSVCQQIPQNMQDSDTVKLMWMCQLLASQMWVSVGTKACPADPASAPSLSGASKMADSKMAQPVASSTDGQGGSRIRMDKHVLWFELA